MTRRLNLKTKNSKIMEKEGSIRRGYYDHVVKKSHGLRNFFFEGMSQNLRPAELKY